MTVAEIPPDRVESVIDTLCEAFYDYPVMRFVIGDAVDNFDAQYRTLIGLFVMARVLCKEPLLGIGNPDHLDAAAAISLPGTQGVPEELIELRKHTWATFEPAAKARYDAFADACNQFDIDTPHHHLNMIGVRNAAQGRGLGKKLVRHVIQLAHDDPESTGVTLSTEAPANLPFYESLGFEIIGHAQVGPGLETWNFYREDA